MIDNAYSHSVHYLYEKWSRCVSTHAYSQTQAMFLISEMGTEYSGSEVYVKIFQIDFSTGSYSIKTSEPFSALTAAEENYYTIGSQFLVDSENDLVDTYLYCVSNGIDADTQQAPFALGFVTSTSDSSRINPFATDLNTLKFYG